MKGANIFTLYLAIPALYIYLRFLLQYSNSFYYDFTDSQLAAMYALDLIVLEYRPINPFVFLLPILIILLFFIYLLVTPWMYIQDPDDLFDQNFRILVIFLSSLILLMGLFNLLFYDALTPLPNIQMMKNFLIFDQAVIDELARYPALTPGEIKAVYEMVWYFVRLGGEHVFDGNQWTPEAIVLTARKLVLDVIKHLILKIKV